MLTTLIDSNVRGHLGRFIPVWGGSHALTGLRITLVPQRRPARRALGWHQLDRLGLSWEWVSYPKCVLACKGAGWLGLRLHRLHRCALCRCHHRSPEWRVRCQHTIVAMPVCAQWGLYVLSDAQRERLRRYVGDRDAAIAVQPSRLTLQRK